MNVAVGTFLCNFLDFRQFTVNLGKNNTVDSCFFLVLHSTFGVYICHTVAQTHHFAHAFRKLFSSVELRFLKLTKAG